jgi:hypothetical protein
MPLFGTWVIWCQKCSHEDTVSGVTDNHNCSQCGNQTVNCGSAIPVCPNGHHVDVVGGITKSVCGSECRR